MTSAGVPHRPLRIVHINTHDEEGGAAKVARQLCRFQNRAGHTAHLLVGRRKTRGRDVRELESRPDDILETFCQEANLQYLHFQGSHELLRHPLVRQADLVHLHNIHFGYFNPVSLSALSHVKPVLWTLHDMHALTGFCNHSFACELWREGCPDCARMIIDQERPSFVGTARAAQAALGIRTSAALKAQVYAASVLDVVCPSRWLGEKAGQGLLRGHPVHVIHNGVDTRVFAPRDKARARARLGLPQDAFIVGSAAVYGVFNNPLKGGAQIREALARIRQEIPGALFLNIGASDVSADEGVLNLPFCSSERDMSWHYAAMDVLLHAAVAETFCLVAAEALACARPVVAFGTGPLPEVVRHGVDGLLAPSGDAQALAAAALRLAADPALAEEMGRAARAGAGERFDLRCVAAAYEALSREVVARHPARVARPRYFDLAALPLLVQTPAFFQAEAEKGGTPPPEYAQARARLAGLSSAELLRAFVASVPDPGEARLFAEVLERDAGHWRDYHRVFALRAEGRFADALAVLDRLREALPRDLRVARTRAVTLGLAGRPASALEAFDACLRIDPEAKDILLSVSDMYRLMHDADRAWAALDAVAARDPGIRGLALRRAMLLEMRGDMAGAAAQYQREGAKHGDAKAGQRARELRKTVGAGAAGLRNHNSPKAP